MTTHKAQHTKGPWQVGPGNVIWSKRPEYAIADIRYPKADSCNPRTIEESKANANFIVVAVNSHADLVAALEAIARGLTNGQLERGETPATIARAALKAAKGE